jgi:hypothetical protein
MPEGHGPLTALVVAQPDEGALPSSFAILIRATPSPPSPPQFLPNLQPRGVLSFVSFVVQGTMALPDWCSIWPECRLKYVYRNQHTPSQPCYFWP